MTTDGVFIIDEAANTAVSLMLEQFLTASKYEIKSYGRDGLLCSNTLCS